MTRRALAALLAFSTPVAAQESVRDLSALSARIIRDLEFRRISLDEVGRVTRGQALLIRHILYSSSESEGQKKGLIEAILRRN